MADSWGHEVTTHDRLLLTEERDGRKGRRGDGLIHYRNVPAIDFGRARMRYSGVVEIRHLHLIHVAL